MRRILKDFPAKILYFPGGNSLKIKLYSVGIIALLMFLPSCSGKSSTPEPSLSVGVEPVLSKINAGDYNEILKSWHKKGFKNRTVIHISPYDGLAFIPDKRLKRIKEVLNGPAPENEEKDMVTGRDYIYAASRLGLVKKIYWVIPVKHIEFIDAEQRIRRFLGGEVSPFRAEDIQSMKLKSGCVSGTLYGTDINICSVLTIPALREKVAITIDTAFFPAFSATKEKNILGVMKLFFDSLASRKFSSDALNIVSMPDETALRGYIADELAAIFREPDKLSKSLPPDLWRLRDQSDNLLAGGGVKEASELLNKRLAEYHDDQYLALMRSAADLLHGKKASSLSVLERQCIENHLFCRGMIDIALFLLKRGDVSEASSVMAKAVKLKPEDRRFRIEYARTLYMQGDYAEAYKIVSGINTAPAMFLAGNCAYALKKHDEAISLYEKALAAYLENSWYRLDAQEQKSIGNLSELYLQRGDVNALKKLKVFPFVQ